MEKVGAFTERTTDTGEWRPGNPATGQQATPMLAAYFNMLQRELVNVVDAAGLNLDVNNDGQLLSAVYALAPSQNVAVFDAVGTTSWTVPDVLKNGRRKACVTVIGGGGGAGRRDTGGGGGGGGGYAEGTVDLTGVNSVSVTVGGGGGGAPVGAGNHWGGGGGTSSFGSWISATGGAGADNWLGGHSGVGIGGYLNYGLGHGESAARIDATRNPQYRGGSGGGPGGTTSGAGATGSPGSAAIGFGGGGGGGNENGAGGNGVRGIVIVRW